MKALQRLSPIFVLALALAACGDDETELPEFATLFPTDNEIGSYVEAAVTGGSGKVNKEAGPYITTDEYDIENRIDGKAEHFIAAGFVNFGFEMYTDSTYDIDLVVWQMKTPDGATTAIAAAAPDPDWDDASLGDAARVDNQSSLWSWFIRKGVYVIEMSCKPTLTGDAAKSEGEAFATAILAKMP